MEGPADGAGADVVGADVARGRGEAFGHERALNEHVLVEDARGGRGDGDLFGVAAEAFAEVDAALFAEARDGLAIGGVEGEQPVAPGEEEAAFLAFLPHHEAAVAAAGWFAFAGVKLPEGLAGGGVEGEDLLLGGGAVEDAVDDQGVALNLGAFFSVAGVVGPSGL